MRSFQHFFITLPTMENDLTFIKPVRQDVLYRVAGKQVAVPSKIANRIKMVGYITVGEITRGIVPEEGLQNGQCVWVCYLFLSLPPLRKIAFVSERREPVGFAVSCL